MRFRVEEDCKHHSMLSELPPGYFAHSLNLGQQPLIPETTTNLDTVRTIHGIFTDTVLVRQHLISTVHSLVVHWKSIPPVATDPDLLTNNVCWPHTLAHNAEPGFALRSDDGYYGNVPWCPAISSAAPAPAITGDVVLYTWTCISLISNSRFS